MKLSIYKKYIFLLIFLNGISIYSQDVFIKLIDEDSNPVQYASILNSSKGTYTFSDNNGLFLKDFGKNDTLKIKHLSYQDKIVIGSEIKDFIDLKSKTIELNEVLIFNEKSISSINFKQSKKKNIYGLGTNRKYAFLIKNNIKDSLMIKEVTIPVKYKNGFNSQGVFIIQFFKKCKDNSVSSEPLSKLFTIDVSDINKEISLKIDKENLFLVLGDFYIIIQRVTPNKTYSTKTKTKSVNPFLFIENKKQSNNFFVKEIGSKVWINSSTVFNPSVCLTVYGITLTTSN